MDGIIGNPPRPVAAQTTDTALSPKEEEAARSFEAVFLTQFVDQMLKTVDTGAMGGGKQAEMWRSFMSEAMARSIVDRGGLGIARSVEKMLATYQESKNS